MGDSDNELVADDVRIDVDEKLASSIAARLQTLSCREELPTIHRVLSSDRASYEPKMVSIGPYHSGKLSIQMEGLKWRYLRDFLGRSPKVGLQCYIKEIKAIESQTRSCYSETIHLGSDEFIQLMVVDGCFLVEFLMKWSSGENDPFFLVGWNLPVLRSDLLKLENQIPFLVLHCIFNASGIADDKCQSLLSLAVGYLISLDAKVLSRLSAAKIHHLLHLFHLCLLPTPTPSQEPCFKRGERHRSPRAIACAKELQEAGVRFKRKEKEYQSLLDISFRNGVMEIPCLSIEYATKVRFQNLIALEQCCPEVGNHLTSYVVFMDCLVETELDVSVLKNSGTIESKVGNDEKAAIYFKEISDCAYLDYESHYLAGLFTEVERYLECRIHKWRANLMHTYFRNPWSILSLFAALVLLVITFLQTIFTILPYYIPRV